MTCSSGNDTFMAGAAELTTALGAYQSGHCLELNMTSTVLVKCSCSIYTRTILLDALVRAHPACLLCSAAAALASLYAHADMGEVCLGVSEILKKSWRATPGRIS